MNLKGLNEERAEILAQMEGMIETAKGEERKLTAEEVESFETLKASEEEVRSNIAVLEAMENTPEIKEEPVVEEVRSQEVITNQIETKNEMDKKTLFRSYITKGWNGLNTEERAALAVGSNQGEAMNGAADLGYTVLDEWAQLVEDTRSKNSLANYVKSLETSRANTIRVPMFTYADNIEGDATGGGLSLISEAAAVGSANGIKFREVELNARKYTTGEVRMSYEILEDSDFDIEGYVMKTLMERAERSLDWMIVNGVAATHGFDGVVTKLAAEFGGEDAAAFKKDIDLFQLEQDTIYAVDAAYRAGGKFFMHTNTYLQLQAISDQDGRSLIVPDFSRGGVPTFRGYEIVLNDHMPELNGVGSAGTATAVQSVPAIIFGQLDAAFTLRTVKGMRVKKLNELYALNDQVAVFGLRRLDMAYMIDSADKMYLPIVGINGAIA